MEILECCIKLNNWIKFEKTFKEAVNIALTPLELAIIYRKYAYFCTELKNYELAYNVLRYSMLMCIRKENQQEIEYLKSKAKMNLTSMPSIGTIEYIREKGLEYKPSEYIISTYLDLAKCVEEEYNNKAAIMSKDKKKMFLRKLLNVYENLYFLNVMKQYIIY